MVQSLTGGSQLCRSFVPAIFADLLAQDTCRDLRLLRCQRQRFGLLRSLVIAWESSGCGGGPINGPVLSSARPHFPKERDADLREDPDGEDDHPRGRGIRLHRESQGDGPGKDGHLSWFSSNTDL